jgi:hypothetical protein
MARIKSALELALERTEGVESDKAGLEEKALVNEARKLASSFLADPDSVDIKATLAAKPKEAQAKARAAVAEVFLSNIGLPSYKEQETRLGAIEKGLVALSGDKSIPALFAQFGQFFERYFSDVEKLEQTMVKQFEPRLRQKEQEMARRSGQAVRMDPLQDPEFARALTQNLGGLREQYEGAVEQARAQLRQVLGLPAKE